MLPPLRSPSPRAPRWIPAALLLALTALGGEAGKRQEHEERDAPRGELGLPPLSAGSEEASAPRLEHFVLELPARAGARPLGALRWIRRHLGAELELEWELDFPREGVRLLAVERLGERGAHLNWRELAGHVGRTLEVAWAQGERGLAIREWARDGTLRESRSAASGAVLPLYLLELARSGNVVQGSFQVFDPTARTLSAIRLATSYSPRVEPPAGAAIPQPSGADLFERSQDPVREVELRREDGTLAGRYRFQGAELLGFEWQEGGLRARRVEVDEYRSALSSLQRPGLHPGETVRLERGSGAEPPPGTGSRERRPVPGGSVREP